MTHIQMRFMDVPVQHAADLYVIGVCSMYTIYGIIAQLVEHPTHNRCVLGSSPNCPNRNDYYSLVYIESDLW